MENRSAVTLSLLIGETERRKRNLMLNKVVEYLLSSDHILPLCNFISEIFTSLKIEVEVFWVLTSCSVVVGYQRFGGSCRLHLQGEVSGVLRHIYPEDLDLRMYISLTDGKALSVQTFDIWAQ
jgi:hypothetical protein